MPVFDPILRQAVSERHSERKRRPGFTNDGGHPLERESEGSVVAKIGDPDVLQHTVLRLPESRSMVLVS
jgi:hypothetical protein